jgi:hypothetical protein
VNESHAAHKIMMTTSQRMAPPNAGLALAFTFTERTGALNAAPRPILIASGDDVDCAAAAKVLHTEASVETAAETVQFRET